MDLGADCLLNLPIRTQNSLGFDFDHTRYKRVELTPLESHEYLNSVLFSCGPNMNGTLNKMLIFSQLQPKPPHHPSSGNILVLRYILPGYYSDTTCFSERKKGMRQCFCTCREWLCCTTESI